MTIGTAGAFGMVTRIEIVIGGEGNRAPGQQSGVTSEGIGQSRDPQSVRKGEKGIAPAPKTAERQETEAAHDQQMHDDVDTGLGQDQRKNGMKDHEVVRTDHVGRPSGAQNSEYWIGSSVPKNIKKYLSLQESSSWPCTAFATFSLPL